MFSTLSNMECYQLIEETQPGDRSNGFGGGLCEEQLGIYVERMVVDDGGGGVRGGREKGGGSGSLEEAAVAMAMVNLSALDEQLAWI